MKKKYIKPIIEYEELDNESSFLTSSHFQPTWNEYSENGELESENSIYQGGEDNDDDGWADDIIID